MTKKIESFFKFSKQKHYNWQFEHSGRFVTETKLNDFHRLLNSCHIFGVQETWLENQESFKVSGFEHFRSGVQRNRHQQISILYRSS